MADSIGDLGCPVMMTSITGEGIDVGYRCSFRVNTEDILPERLEGDVDSAKMEEAGDIVGRVVSLGRDCLGHAIKYQPVYLGMTG